MGLRRDLFAQRFVVSVRLSLEPRLERINFSIHLNTHSAPQPNECGRFVLYYINIIHRGGHADKIKHALTN